MKRIFIALLASAALSLAVGCSRPADTAPGESTFRKIDSRAIRAVQYGKATQTLYVFFKSGRLYCYEDVPVTVYEGLLASESKGAYFVEHVRNKCTPLEMHPGVASGSDMTPAL